MKRRFTYLLALYGALIALFAIEKPLFLLAQSKSLRADTGFVDWLAVMWHGLSLDISVAGYVILLPWLIVLVSVWVPGQKWPGVANRIYFIFASLFLAAVFVGNMLLYPFWNFPLDTSPLFYLKNPQEAVASVPGWYTVVGFLFIVVLWLLMNRGLGRISRIIDQLKPVINKVGWSLLLIVVGGLVFLGIRGGVSQSTANVGRVYFSDNLFLNHSAVNPAFSFIESAVREQNLAKEYSFFTEKQRAELFDSLKAPEPDSIRRVLNTNRPNVLIVLLESFSMNILAENVDGEPVTPQFNSLVAEGVWFPQFYANSFRTDRGIVSVLNGYPAQPTTSIMKYPAKSQTLPSIAKSLHKAGYATDMLYGGDIDFTNMRSYFYASGYESVTGSDGLKLEAKKSEWGYHDDVMFEELYRRLVDKNSDKPFFSTFLSLSSHEPFKVPFERFADPILNSMAFTDDCFGRFIGKLKNTTVWDNLLVILVADHAMTYPASLKHYQITRHHIPMLWLGGAVSQPETVDSNWSQTDIAATLLRQMDLDDSEFIFSRNIFNPDQKPVSFYTFNNGFGYIDPTGATVWDCDTQKPVVQSEEQYAYQREQRGKAILQTLMVDMDNR